MPKALREIAAAILALWLASTAYAEPAACRAVDGDTFVCYGERIRLENIDAPEIHGRCVNETNAAEAAKKFAQHALDDARVIEVIVHQRRPRDRFGRTLARVRLDGVDLGDLMIQARLARAYHGERRQSWCD